MDLLKTIGLTNLMSITRGRQETRIGLIDGPVDVSSNSLMGARISTVSNLEMGCRDQRDFSCTHGTFLASALVGKEEGGAFGMCSDCTLLLRPIFSASSEAGIPTSDAITLASAIVDTVEAGASVINLSLSVNNVGRQGSVAIADAVDFACSRGAIIVAASGNDGELSSSPLTSHSWTLPVVAYDDKSVMSFSNVGRSIGRNGLGAPGHPSFNRGTRDFREQVIGTSVAAVFVTGAAALLLSEFPEFDAAQIVQALRVAPGCRRTVIPPLLDAWASYRQLDSERNRTKVAGRGCPTGR